jgi:hypothetical protein
VHKQEVRRPFDQKRIRADEQRLVDVAAQSALKRKRFSSVGCTRIVTFWMKTMVPLRLLGLGSNVFFIAYGDLAAAHPPRLLHILLLPLNIVRLREMMLLVKQVEKAASSELNMAWIKPFTTSRRMTAGEILFSKGETANSLFVVVSGLCRLMESG